MKKLNSYFHFKLIETLKSRLFFLSFISELGSLLNIDIRKISSGLYLYSNTEGTIKGKLMVQ